MTSFGAYIANARKKIGMSQKDLASKILKEDGAPISPQYLNDIERDRRNPPNEDMLRQFASELDLPLDYLHYLAGQLPVDVQNVYEPEKVKEAFKAFRKTIKGG